MEQIVIRKAVEKDRKQIADAIAVCYKEDFSVLAKDISKAASALLPGIQILRFYVAELDGKIIGIAACSDCSGRAVHVDGTAYRNSFGIIKGTMAILFMKNEFMHTLQYPIDTGYIEFVGVLPDYQGRSVAKKLMTGIIQMSEYKNYILDVKDNNIPAIKCYEHIGFKEYQRIPERGGKVKGFKERVFMKYGK